MTTDGSFNEISGFILLVSNNTLLDLKKKVEDSFNLIGERRAIL